MLPRSLLQQPGKSHTAKAVAGSRQSHDDNKWVIPEAAAAKHSNNDAATNPLYWLVDVRMQLAHSNMGLVRVDKVSLRVQRAVANNSAAELPHE